ncbi:nucleotidyltransferase family protein [Patescibacteria group bacterium]|nr:nucleotidyltransferase family protein [Patescibacteria group bacterium]MBP9710058.1 nucleotidyltransferase family protein [Patescibacteria group bacterium]
MIRHAVILAGGSGTRLRPVTLEIPKPLVPVQGLPIVSWQVRWLARHGVEEVTVVIAPRWRQQFTRWAEELMKEVPVKIVLHEESEPMGTMGAMVHHLRDRWTEPVLVTNGDELKGLNLSVLVEKHLQLKAQDPQHAVTLGLIRVFNPSDYGVAEMENDHIVKFHNKPAHPPTNLINSGLYILEPSVLHEVDRSKSFLMFEEDLFPLLANARRLGGAPLEGLWYDCGTLERWEKAIKEWKEPEV